MPRDVSMQMGMPRFRGAVRNLIIFMGAIYLVLLLLTAFATPLAQAIFSKGILSPQGIHSWQLWRFVTYGFLHDDPLNFLFAMLAIYFLGTALEQRIGPRAFLELVIFSMIGAGALGFLLSLSGKIAQGPAYGSGPAANAILMVFFMFNRDAPIMLIPIPIPIKVKYIVIFTAAIEGAYLLLTHFSLFFTVQLLGLVTGYLWVKAAWRRRSLVGIAGEMFAGVSNSYYRWKRRRATRKFKVYMRKHQEGPQPPIDERSTFHPPDDKKNGPGGWVN